MTTEPHKIQLFLAVNELGEFMTHADSASEAIDELRDNYGYEAVRVIELNVAVDLPKTEAINVAVTVPAETKSPAQVTVS